MFAFCLVHLTNDRKIVYQLEGKHIYLLTSYLTDQNVKAAQIQDFQLLNEKLSQFDGKP